MAIVLKRCVFYVSGFDPKGSGHYHALYRDECARQSLLDGQCIDVGARHRQPSGNAAWAIHAKYGDQQVQIHYEFMRWDDIVRRHWPKTTLALWASVVATTIFNVRHGTWWKMFRLSWPPAVALMAPFLLVCAMVLGIPLMAFSSAWCVIKALGNLGLGVASGYAVAYGLWVVAQWLQARYSMYWMMRSYAFTAKQAKSELPDLEDRLDELARALVKRVEAQQDDEVLVVGHSSGSIMAVSIVARALQAAPHLLQQGRPKVALLTLAQSIPLLGLLPMANKFRAEMQTLADADGLTWVDFSAPSDGCCFALTDPFEACAIVGSRQRGVDFKILNPRFANLFDATTYASLKRNKLLLHFQYLRAAQIPGDYNYFAITAGPVSLDERFFNAESVNNYKGLRPFG